MSAENSAEAPAKYASRWIEQRAECAVDDNRDWRELSLPKHDPRIRRLEESIKTLAPIIRDIVAAAEQAVGEKIRAAHTEQPYERVAVDLRFNPDDLDIVAKFARQVGHVDRRLLQHDEAADHE